MKAGGSERKHQWAKSVGRAVALTLLISLCRSLVTISSKTSPSPLMSLGVGVGSSAQQERTRETEPPKESAHGLKPNHPEQGEPGRSSQPITTLGAEWRLPCQPVPSTQASQQQSFEKPQGLSSPATAQEAQGLTVEMSQHK